jgi:hypothetical protein
LLAVAAQAASSASAMASPNVRMKFFIVFPSGRRLPIVAAAEASVADVRAA